MSIFGGATAQGEKENRIRSAFHEAQQRLISRLLIAETVVEAIATNLPREGPIGVGLSNLWTIHEVIERMGSGVVAEIRNRCHPQLLSLFVDGLFDHEVGQSVHHFPEQCRRQQRVRPLKRQGSRTDMLAR